ncbi:MAG: hypothetical protein HC781_15080 [Leptolyngbyaceae cyanobacterium CSU_1_4]|nr:hypothetical protein [Leptolyngbyaceae cyanobacterium CSU_1_4]
MRNRFIEIDREKKGLFNISNCLNGTDRAHSVDHQSGRTRDRVTQRRVSVLDQLPALDPQGVGIERIVRVERTGTRGANPMMRRCFTSVL